MTLLQVLLAEYGTKEISGSEHNKTIIQYAKEAGHNWVNDDETPWCSIFIDWGAMKAGVERTKSASARSWLKVGEVITEPILGDIVIFKRGSFSWQGHVGVFINYDDNYINVLGGNQSNQVKISKYNAKKVLGFRRLKLIKHEYNNNKTHRIKFAGWDDYEKKVNELAANGWEIAETLVQWDFAPLTTSEHLVRLKRCDE